MKAVTSQQMRDIEAASVAAGVSLDQLMENAGRAVANAVSRREGPIYGRRVVVLVGPGNNGGDGLVAARLLANRGAHVRCFILTKRSSDDPKRMLAIDAGCRVNIAGDDPAEFRRVLESADLILDAVLGTGKARPISGDLADWLALTKASGRPIHAIDLPTGLDSDSGRFDPSGLPANVTYFLGFPKVGALTGAGEGNLGEFDVLDIGIPIGLANDIDTELIDADLAASLLPSRPADANKGTFGRALIVAGSPNYVGAATLATAAASRSGTGLVALATRRSVYELIAGRISDAIYYPLPESSAGPIDPVAAARHAFEAMETATASLIGPGLGREPETESFVRSLLSQAQNDKPVVMDADCLNILAGKAKWWETVGDGKILTPHPGEMGRLLGVGTGHVQSDRLGVARSAAAEFNAIVVLKGAATIVASPDGRAWISPWVNPGLAKGGTGDVLAGILVGLLAQMPSRLGDAATLAVYIHGLAGNFALRRFGPEAMTASDVVNCLTDAFGALQA